MDSTVTAIGILETEIRLATQIAEQSRQCQRKAVGVSIVWFGNSGIIPVIRTSNGPSRAGAHCTNEVGNCGCSHAEPRAVMRLLQGHQQRHVGSFVMLCNYSPCTSCANWIIDCGMIGGVIYEMLTEHDLRGLAFLDAVMPVLTFKDLHNASEILTGREQHDGERWSHMRSEARKIHDQFAKWQARRVG